MVKKSNFNQIKIEDFKDPIQKELNPENRWVKLAESLPWDKLEEIYSKKMSKDHGRPGIDARRVIGALIIKHKLNLSDEETIKTIQENSYIQFFLGYESYSYEQVFASSLFVTIRYRIGDTEFDEMNRELMKVAFPRKKSKPKGQSSGTNDNAPPPDSTGSAGKADQDSSADEIPKLKEDTSCTGTEKRDTCENDSEEVPKKGSIIMDATVAEQAIKYPTDLDLLNESREISEKLIDLLYPKSDLQQKPRTYRRNARKEYLSTSKKKKQSLKKIRQANKKQLNYIRRNLNHIENLLDMIGGSEFPLKYKYQRKYWIIQEVYSQQREMNDEKKNHCDNRIVSISQPHVRPIVRGKKERKTEFGSKLGVFMIDGYARIANLSWDAYNESADLIEIIENYRKETGFYPEKVRADNIYGNKKNRQYMKERGIEFVGKPLGRPKKVTQENKEEITKEKKRRKQEYKKRIPIEGKFGQGKNGYNMNYIRAKKQDTSESWVSCIIFVMNIVKLTSKKINSIINLVKSGQIFLKFVIISKKHYIFNLC